MCAQKPVDVCAVMHVPGVHVWAEHTLPCRAPIWAHVPCRDRQGSRLFGCQKAASSGPEGSPEHLDLAEEHLSPGAAAGWKAPSPSLCTDRMWRRQGRQAVYQAL